MTKVSGYRYSSDVLLGGRSIFNYRDVLEFRRRVGMLFQRPNPFPMSIMDNVLAGVRAHKLVPRKEFRGVAQARLTEVGLWDAVRIGSAIHRFDSLVVSSSCCA